MKKLITAAFAFAAVLSAGAQIAEVSAPQPLLQGVQSNMYNPVLSADGQRLLFTHADFTDLRMYDFADGVTVRIDADRTKAFKARFRGAEVSFDANDGVRVSGSKLIVTRNGVTNEYTPVECQAGYCWASVSPDGTKIVFLAAGKGLVVTDMQGNVLSRPGNFEAPVWYGNDHLVVQNSTDDGHQLHSSQILLITADGTRQQALTRPESMTMTPAASIQAGRVVYGTVDGRLYQVSITLK